MTFETESRESRTAALDIDGELVIHQRDNPDAWLQSTCSVPWGDWQ